MEKIAIITFATGNYTQIFSSFKHKLLQNFLSNKDRNIFLFTDNLNLNHESSIYIPHLPWPLCTLLRFYHINRHKEQFEDYNYIYYLDVDMIAEDSIDEEIFPNNNEIVCVSHYWNNTYELYENVNERSTAYVPKSNTTNYQYCQGCFFGSTKDSFLSMSSELENNINIDLKNNTIAKWHDESHLNKYIISHPHKILHKGYAHPINFPVGSDKIKFIHKNANSWGLI